MFEVNLIELPNKILRKHSKNVLLPLNKTNVKLIKKMIYHIDSSQEASSQFRAGVGVAAVQYGILKRIFYVNIPDGNNGLKPAVKDAIINPQITWKSEEKVAIHSGEGCLSVNEKWPKQEGLVRRSLRIKVKAFSYYQNEEIELDLNGYPAIVFQHELDHLDGKLFIDHLDQNDLWGDENITLV